MASTHIGMSGQDGAGPGSALSPQHRRLAAEWSLLEQMARLNPQRLVKPFASDTTFHVTLLATPALALEPQLPDVTTHSLRIVYPAFFPSVPLELYLKTPMLHPNIHPQTGFVCLWEDHRITNGVEHALHKTAAILGWQLINLAQRHQMQAVPQAGSQADREGVVRRLQAPPLRGVSHPAASFLALSPVARRTRLS